MPATIELLPRKEFKITLESGEVISGKYGTWALKRFCSKHNILLTEVSTTLASPSLDHAVDYVLSATEQYFREQKTKTSFPYDDVDCCLWIDQLGGIGGDNFIKVFNHASDKSDDQKKSNDLAAA